MDHKNEAIYRTPRRYFTENTSTAFVRFANGVIPSRLDDGTKIEFFSEMLRSGCIEAVKLDGEKLKQFYRTRIPSKSEFVENLKYIADDERNVNVGHYKRRIGPKEKDDKDSKTLDQSMNVLAAFLTNMPVNSLLARNENTRVHKYEQDHLDLVEEDEEDDMSTSEGEESKDNEEGNEENGKGRNSSQKENLLNEDSDGEEEDESGKLPAKEGGKYGEDESLGTGGMATNSGGSVVEEDSVSHKNEVANNINENTIREFIRDIFGDELSKMTADEKKEYEDHQLMNLITVHESDYLAMDEAMKV